jgi:predicted membrane-bound mannosyltransferase
MFATKETWIIMFAAMVIALFASCLLASGSKLVFFRRREFIRHLSAAIFSGAIFSVLFYSSFFTNPQGIYDSIATFKTYFSRAGQNEWHLHPWHFYGKILLFFKLGDGPVFSEALVLMLAAPGLFFAMGKKEIPGMDKLLLRFLAFYTILVAIIFSLIPYKTPWNVLGFWHGMILLAGVGAVYLFQINMPRAIQLPITALLAAGFLHLCWLSYTANFKLYTTPENPYVYAHPMQDVLTVTERIKKISEAHPEGRNIYIEAIFPGDDYWPFPWYLRSFPHVGWWSKVNENTPAAPIILCSPMVEEELTEKLYLLPPPGKRHLYVPMFDQALEIRPQVEMRVYVRKDLWDYYQQRL